MIQLYAEAKGQSVHILIIDDEEAIGMTLRELLGFEGYTASHATTIEDALLMAQEQHPDAVLCDWGLPDGTGLDVMAQLPNVPIIIMSGNDQKTIGAENLNRTAGYIIKPFKAQTVLLAVRSALTERK